MKLAVTCDFCGNVFERDSAFLKGKRHHFCSRQCLADFSSKSRNPQHYADLKDFTNMGVHMAQMNRELNPTRMTVETREKLRQAHLNTGEGKTYTKVFGVHEHRVVAEQILGRPLRENETVHHRDGNKRNNTPENLIIFRSQSEHAKHHAEMKWFLRELVTMEGGDAR